MRYNLLRSPRPNRHAEWLVLRRISHSLPRGHGIPSSYTRLIGSDRHACAYNTVTERLPSSSYVWAVGVPSTPMGGSYLRIKSYSRTGCGVAIHCNGGQLPLDQALLTYRLWGWGVGIHSNGGQLPPDQAPPSDYILRSKKSEGHHTPE